MCGVVRYQEIRAVRVHVRDGKVGKENTHIECCFLIGCGVYVVVADRSHKERWVGCQWVDDGFGLMVLVCCGVQWLVGTKRAWGCVCKVCVHHIYRCTYFPHFCACLQALWPVRGRERQVTTENEVTNVELIGKEGRKGILTQGLVLIVFEFFVGFVVRLPWPEGFIFR